jgi:hypothetical protein
LCKSTMRQMASRFIDLAQWAFVNPASPMPIIKSST